MHLMNNISNETQALLIKEMLVRPETHLKFHDVLFTLNARGAVITGSRHFGHASVESDWDFFVGEKEFKNLLLPGGLRGHFHLDDAECSYIDNNTAVVFAHNKFPIHLQLVQDFELKLKAQNLLETLPRGVLASIPKVLRRKLWDWAQGHILQHQMLSSSVVAAITKQW